MTKVHDNVETKEGTRGDSYENNDLVFSLFISYKSQYGFKFQHFGQIMVTSRGCEEVDCYSDM